VEKGVALKAKRMASGAAVALAVSDVLTYPQMTPNEDEETQRSMVQLALEQQVSSRVLSEDGWGMDSFSVSGDSVSQAVYVIDNDALETDGAMHHCEFDFSARLHAVAGDAYVIWRERGRWIAACCNDGKMFYAEVLGTTESLQNLSSSLRVMAMRFMMVGIGFEPKQVVVHESDQTIADSVGASLEGFDIPVQYDTQFSPAFPAEVIGYTPSYVVEWRYNSKVAKQRSLMFAVVVVLCLLGFGYLWMQKKALVEEANKYTQIIEKHQPMMLANEEFRAKRAELDNMWTTEWPVELLLRCREVLPRGYEGNLRFTSVKTRPGYFSVKGMAKKGMEVPFLRELRKRFEEAGYKWNAGKKSKKGDYWEFGGELILQREEEGAF